MCGPGIGSSLSSLRGTFNLIQFLRVLLNAPIFFQFFNVRIQLVKVVGGNFAPNPTCKFNSRFGMLVLIEDFNCAFGFQFVINFPKKKYAMVYC